MLSRRPRKGQYAIAAHTVPLQGLGITEKVSNSLNYLKTQFQTAVKKNSLHDVCECHPTCNAGK